MTAVTTRHPRAPQSDTQLLRFAMRADATVCGGVGLFVAMAADPLSRLTGLTATAEWIAGAALVAYGVALYSLARVPDIRRAGVTVLAGSVLFSIGVAVVLAAGLLPLTAFGVAVTVAFTVVTVGFAWLQYLGVRRIPT
ncbi:hypothetical protein [Mycolicibacterium parafortuitum]|uniref:Uncharacterized protein n=1 Tax=Mycolicibacterium parafortuitum TaxID=39692 RepID=A0A375YR20_MYCPF|nr:hypothetical protein [Mycolicibacterium parafortuitum]ORB28167.1 hypothetical protein BST38_21715 [Mycolicibacterium parafortuitum]SRX83605.1 hypothetical protein MPP7335_05385 [Mycolicibacterium parafortuitum]